MKGAAWDALVAAWPESKDVARYDVEGFSNKLGLIVLTYKDQQTGLIWAKNGNIVGKTMSWNDAINWVKQLTFDGYNDWRLPTKNELQNFIKRYDHSVTNNFSNIQDGWYWTSTEENDNFVWGMGMNSKSIFRNHKSSENYVWPVRGVDVSNIGELSKEAASPAKKAKKRIKTSPLE
jgi:hypothetical protein